MEDSQVTTLIEKKIAEAKLDSAEKRLRLILIIGSFLFTVIGILIPYNSSTRLDNAIREMKTEINNKFGELTANINQRGSENESRVTTAIKTMNDQFNVLAGNQLRKPVIECKFNDRNLDGSELIFDKDSKSYTLQLKNIGDGAAKNIKMRLYIKTSQEELDVNWYDETGWENTFCDNNAFSRAYQFIGLINGLDTDEPYSFKISIMESERLKKENIAALLQIFYEQPESKKIFFTLVIR